MVSCEDMHPTKPKKHAWLGVLRVPNPEWCWNCNWRQTSAAPYLSQVCVSLCLPLITIHISVCWEVLTKIKGTGLNVGRKTFYSLSGHQGWLLPLRSLTQNQSKMKQTTTQTLSGLARTASARSQPCEPESLHNPDQETSPGESAPLVNHHRPYKLITKQ